MELSKQASSIIRYFSLAVILILLGVFTTESIGLFKGGLTENWNRFIFYIIFPPAAALIILALLITELVIKKGDETYGGSLAFNSPEDTPHISKYFKWMQNPLKLFLASAILFSFMGLYVAFTKQAFMDVGQLPQAFTVIDNLLFSTLLVTVSENLGVAAWLAAMLFGLRYYARKNNWSSANFSVLAWVGAIVVFFLYGVLNHYSRYGNSDVAIISVAIFWILGGILTMLTGSFLPFWVMHMSNNFFLDISQSFSNDIIVIWSIIAIIMLIALFVFIMIKFPSRKREEFIQV